MKRNARLLLVLVNSMLSGGCSPEDHVTVTFTTAQPFAPGQFVGIQVTNWSSRPVAPQGCQDDIVDLDGGTVWRRFGCTAIMRPFIGYGASSGGVMQAPGEVGTYVYRVRVIVDDNWSFMAASDPFEVVSLDE